MDLLHIRIFKRPKQCYSIIYKIEDEANNSRFVSVENYREYLWKPGIDPTWINIVLNLQKLNPNQAKQYVLDELKKCKGIDVGFSWSHSDYSHDAFVDQVLMLVGFE